MGLLCRSAGKVEPAPDPPEARIKTSCHTCSAFAANDKIRMAIIGAGNRGGRVFDSLATIIAAPTAEFPGNVR
jgi:hypothetical protein